MTADYRVAIITGSARGIGAATVEKFSTEGYRTAAVDVLDEGKILCEELTAKGRVCQFYQCDVANEVQVKEVVDSVVNQHGRIDVLVNNAGIVLVKSLLIRKQVRNWVKKSLYWARRRLRPSEKMDRGVRSSPRTTLSRKVIL